MSVNKFVTLFFTQSGNAAEISFLSKGKTALFWQKALDLVGACFGPTLSREGAAERRGFPNMLNTDIWFQYKSYFLSGRREGDM